jgi:hypothetical protein
MFVERCFYVFIIQQITKILDCIVINSFVTSLYVVYLLFIEPSIDIERSIIHVTMTRANKQMNCNNH